MFWAGPNLGVGGALTPFHTMDWGALEALSDRGTEGLKDRGTQG